MKTTRILSLLIASLFSFGLQAQNVSIPDANFKAYLVGNSNINTNNDSDISVSEAFSFSGTIDCADLGISDLTGIEAFTQLYGLNCGENQISSLDLSSNTDLVFLNAVENYLTTLDLSSNTNLAGVVWLHKNSLTSLTLPNSSAITGLYANFNSLTSIDVSDLSGLETLFLINNSLTSLDLSSNTALTNISLGNNPLTSINLSGLTDLLTFSAQASDLTELDFSTCSSLYAVYCPNITTLTELNLANGNNMSMGPNDINFTGCTGLTCVTVDNVSLSNQVWPPFFESGVSFSTDCSTGSTPLVTNIVVSGLQGANTVEVGAELQMEAIITPAEASQVVMWQVQSGTGEATIDQNTGLLTGVAAGTVTVGAAATDGSGIYGVIEITVEDTATSLGYHNPNISKVSVYPNPATDQCIISTPEALVSVRLYALDGSLILSTTSKHLDLTSIKSGLYLMVIETETNTVNQKLIIK